MSVAAREVLAGAALLLACVTTQGCSTRAWYEGMKTGHDNQCALGPVSEYDDCVDRHTDGYDDYQAKREQVVSAPEDDRVGHE